MVALFRDQIPKGRKSVVCREKHIAGLQTFHKFQSTGHKPTGTCLRKVSLNEIKVSVRARPNGCNLS